MIFVAVGTQFPFDRLVKLMDEWAAEHDEKVIAQISDGKYLPQHIEWYRFLDGAQYNKNIQDAAVFVSHAGMGNIISAREQGTPIIVMNRQYKLGEHRNDHQADGLKWMAKLDGVYTASTQQELFDHLGQIDKLQPADPENRAGNPELTAYIANYIKTGKR